MQTPLWNALRQVAQSEGSCFSTPGHNRGKGLAPLFQLLGQYDLTELANLDNLSAPETVIAEAQALAAQAWGSQKTWFLVNGATVGIHAMLLATLYPGDTILLPRNVHQSIVHGLILSGANPIFLAPPWDDPWQLMHGLSVEQVEAAFEENPDIKAVLVVHPTYFGAVGDTRGIAEVAHRHGVPLLVDAAHGSHLCFHPDLPDCALACGADLVVHSAHKTLPALTQSALLHGQGSRIDFGKVQLALRLLQTTSPSYLLMASLDYARAWMQEYGQAALTKVLEARTNLAVPFPCLDVSVPKLGLWLCDPTRLCVDVSALGWNGYAAEDWLLEQSQIHCELSTLHHLVFILNTAHEPLDFARLQSGLNALAQTKPLGVPPWKMPPPPLPKAMLSPRAAFEHPYCYVSLQEAVGQVSAQTVSTYPPGIPVLFTGEEISAQIVDYLETVKSQGGSLNGLDPLGKIAVCS
ncbi:MAG: aminotransferase class I/II-fold pyridoxal phosphate-dependent enzyme [Anaerolineae bacterium]|nr:aminotransferase class I/II-fold pyridoxal phosphate-dependent enzyme [Gloeobacterales cyanobacterium ES-bin-313]